ncbi:uncharacterized protein LY89DRAFT_33551 [Mollisia scopiformis]|uniref:Uncharacterized protein n=1 Tax=Mollisia scopiformis TaxID=149040 RepID=A0A194XCN7_MOLSC|nr:uncharacterized protein LY89DRAFT_33551 [Mollisia scopiformis]KUJ17938.1 hypothetical protein LY89DRAFT_33551 [Mollisia scopiformis]
MGISLDLGLPRSESRPERKITEPELRVSFPNSSASGTMWCNVLDRPLAAAGGRSSTPAKGEDSGVVQEIRLFLRGIQVRSRRREVSKHDLEKAGRSLSNFVLPRCLDAMWLGDVSVPPIPGRKDQSSPQGKLSQPRKMKKKSKEARKKCTKRLSRIISAITRG